MKPRTRSLFGLVRPIARVAGDHRGATAIEYGFIIALVVIAMVTALGSLGSTTSGMWNNVSAKVNNAN